MNMKDHISRTRTSDIKSQLLMAVVEWARRTQVAMAIDKVKRKAAERKAYRYSLDNGNGT